MFVSSFHIRHLFNKQLLIQSKLIILIDKYTIFFFPKKKGTCFIRYQSQLNPVFDQNEQQLGLFKNFDINEQTQQRLKGE
jgi:hypothetical protein